MPNIHVEDLTKQRKKIHVSLSVEEMEPFLERAAKEISTQKVIAGFRSGHAPRSVVEKQVGEMKLLEAALEHAVRKTFVDAVLDHHIETVGQPHINVEKLAPGNLVSYSAEVSIMPHVKTLANTEKLTIKHKASIVDEKEIDAAISDLVRMQTKEVRAQKDCVVEKKNKVVLAINIKKGGVPMEGGSSPNQVVYIDDEEIIPGLHAHLLGLKEGHQKTFPLTLNNEEREVDITIRELYDLEPPSVDDVFAKSLGQESVASLRSKISENILVEKNLREKQRQERELLELLTKKTTFDEIPDLLVNEEVQKMIAELQQNIQRQGGVFEDYLAHIKKTVADLKLDLTADALIRIKVALVLQHVAHEQKIDVSQEELDQHIERLAHAHEGNKNVQDYLYSQDYRQYATIALSNKKTVEYFMKKIMKLE